MPIYAYRCESCGHAADVLQKMSDPVLTVCPACGADTYRKQLTAAGFQLKGSGWYVTDFRGGGSKPAAGGAASAGSAEAPATAGGDAKPTDSGGSSGSTSGGGAAAAAPSAPSSSGGGCGTGCGCH